MDNKNPVKIVHLILMVLMMAGTIGAAVHFIIPIRLHLLQTSSCWHLSSSCW